MTADQPAAGTRLLRGTGPGLGPIAESAPQHERTLLHVLARQAERRPDQDWLVFDGLDRLTFLAAQQAAYRVAAAVSASFSDAFSDALSSDTAAATPVVALLLRNQLEFIPAFLGAQAAGGVAAPLNPELRGPLLETLLARCHAGLLVIRADLLEVLAAAPGIAGVRLVVACGGPVERTQVHGVAVVRWDDWCAGQPVAPPAAFPQPSDLAALMFTSGTSGGSKAAMWPQHYLYLSSAGIADSMELTARDVLSTPLQMCHIAGLQNFANAALQVGATAHLTSYFSARRWWTEIARDGATFAMLMGQMAAMILDVTPRAPSHRLGHVYILPQPARRAEFESRYATTVIWQGWGMTEIFPHLPTKSRIEGVPPDTIGPAPNWVDYGVVDASDELLAPNELGEMVYRPLIPDAMARGYFGDPEATDAAFRNGMFHTGDLGYYDERGLVHFVMRNQDAIRRRGENISAVELETLAREHPHVLDAAAYAVPAELGEHEVKLDVVLNDVVLNDVVLNDVVLNDVVFSDELGEHHAKLDQLHEWLVANLPRFMVPRYLEHRSELPRTVSQRVEKYKLAREPVDRPEVRRYTPPARS